MALGVVRVGTVVRVYPFKLHPCTVDAVIFRMGSSASAAPGIVYLCAGASGGVLSLPG